MDGNFGELKKEVMAPPAPEISIRTMESDIKALEQGGGEMPTPKTFSQSAEKLESKFEVAGYAGAEKPIFSPMPGIAPKQTAEELERQKSGGMKFLIITIIIVMAVIGIGFLGYFIFSNWIFPAQMPAA